MKKWTIEITNKDGFSDPEESGIIKNAGDLGIAGIDRVHYIRVYVLYGNLSEKDVTQIAEKILTDPVTEKYSYSGPVIAVSDSQTHVVEIFHNPGVMDPVETSVLKAVRDMNVPELEEVRTAKKYLITGSISKSQVRKLAEKLLYNKVIQHTVDPDDIHEVLESDVQDYVFNLCSVNLLEADDDTLQTISKDGQLSLTLEEMLTIKDYFTKLGRNPTDCELEVLAQTWSEHCKHKTLCGLIEYNGEIIDNLLKKTIMKATKDLDKPWCVSVFHDNAGIIEFDEEYNICFKVETHNHPSALEPYGGAGTGIGGVIRDILGTGLGAKPILNTDVFCFGKIDIGHDELPPGTLHPKRVMKGVVSGVRDYGNRMGIPTSNGAVLFHENYLGNPLVYCGTVGIMPHNASFKKVHPGDLVVVVGGRTGRDGIHGATFSSIELTHESETISSSAVQIGNPITEKKITDTLLQAQKENLYSAITDCGAGGLSSAVGEMGEETGAVVHLEKIPLKYHGLSYWEIWISEAQERMVLSVPPENRDHLLEIFSNEDVEATVIGTFTDDKHLKLFYEDTLVCDMDMSFVHDGVPRNRRKATWKEKVLTEQLPEAVDDYSDVLRGVLSMPNVASKEWVIRQYDHEVQGGSVLKPLQGVQHDGPGDATIVRPRLDSDKGIIVSNGINPRFGLIDPYWMALSVIDEALRQIVAVGGDLNQVAILDNFSWGNTNDPEKLGSMVRCCQGCYDAAMVYETPFISGKDSLNNEFNIGDKTVSIPPTLLISAVAVMDNVEHAISMDLKKEGNYIYIIGETANELGGSQYMEYLGQLGANVPKLTLSAAKTVLDRVSQSTSKGLIASLHDCSDGGMAVATTEMAFSGGFGVQIDLTPVPVKDVKRNDQVLFSESNSRFIAEVSPENKESFEMTLGYIPFALVGMVTGNNRFVVKGLEGRTIIDENIYTLKEAWQQTLRDL